jgi:hypothetical protein
MIALWSFAHAARPPGLDVDAELATWEARAAALLAGPTGCWELSGTVDLFASGYVPATRWTRPDKSDHHLTGPFTARIEDGTWTRFDYTLRNVDEKADPEDDFEIPILPLLGRTKEKPDDGEAATTSVSVGSGGVAVTEQGGVAMNTLHRVLDAIDPATATAYAQWDDRSDGVALFQDYPLEEGRGSDVITIRTGIPAGGPTATSLDITFPGRVRVGDGLVKATIFDAQGHVRTQVVAGPDGATTVLPTLESLSLGLGALGFTVGYEQKIRYADARPCAR